MKRDEDGWDAVLAHHKDALAWPMLAWQRCTRASIVGIASLSLAWLKSNGAAPYWADDEVNKLEETLL